MRGREAVLQAGLFGGSEASGAGAGEVEGDEGGAEADGGEPGEEADQEGGERAGRGEGLRAAAAQAERGGDREGA